MFDLNYKKSYYLTHPHILIEEIFDNLKWAYQRVFRGWDDRVVWSIDYFLNDHVPSWLERLKETKHGTPMEFFTKDDLDNPNGTSDEACEIANEKWNDELNKMIAGFRASKDINDMVWKTVEEYRALEVIRLEGMISFVEHYHSLWD